MKLKIKTNILLENLNYVSKALSSRNIIPILDGILIDLNKKGLFLTATNSDLTIKTFIDKSDILEINETGQVVIIGKYLLEIIRKLPSETVTIEEIEGFKVLIYTNSSKYNLNCYNIEDFPKINIEENDRFIEIESGTLKHLIEQTVFATSTQEKIPLLTGINLKIDDNLLTCVATDSYRLAKKEITIKTGNIKANIVVPASNIVELLKIIEDIEDKVRINIFSNKILFIYKNIMFQSSLLNGTYPNTDSLIPNEFEYEFESDLTKLYDAIDRASLLTVFKEKTIIQMEIKDKNLLLSSFTPEIGKVEELLPIKVNKGDNIKIAFSAKYMLEALKSFTGTKVIVLCNGEIKPIIIKDIEEKNLVQLILPFKNF